MADEDVKEYSHLGPNQFGCADDGPRTALGCRYDRNTQKNEQNQLLEPDRRARRIGEAEFTNL
jgi:hypothetical protein